MVASAKAKTAPPEIIIFQRFVDSTSSRPEALIAYGIFTEAIRDGEFYAGNNYAADIDRLFSSIKPYCLDQARVALLQSSAAAIHEQKAEIAKAHKGFRWWGVTEAVLAALIWPFILIGLTFLTLYVKPDVIEIPKNIIEHRQQQH